MSDALAARREARRKRILENSQNRLQQISGNSNCGTLQNSTLKYSVNCSYDNAEDIISNSANNGQEELSNFILQSDVNETGHGEIINDLTALLSTNTASVDENKKSDHFWYFLADNKYDIVILSLVIQLLYSLHVVYFDNTYFFLPLVLYDITKYLFYPMKSNSSIANVLLLLNGLQPSNKRLSMILESTKWTTALSQDVCIYLFTTICVQSLYHTVKSQFVS